MYQLVTFPQQYHVVFPFMSLHDEPRRAVMQYFMNYRSILKRIFCGLFGSLASRSSSTTHSVNVKRNNTNLFIIWHPFQQRAKVLSDKSGARPYWISYSWENKNILLKFVSYLLKFLTTLFILIRKRPQRVFVQLPPAPLLYAASIYKWFSNSQLILDCHNSLFCSHWIRWPGVVRLLNSKRTLSLTHNDDIAAIAASCGVESMTLLDPLPERNFSSQTELPLTLKKHEYIIVPFSFSNDEPVEEFLAAARRLPNQKFVITWFKEHAYSKIQSRIPENILFTGFLDMDTYESVFSNASCALALTTRDGTQLSVATEAIGFGVPLIVSDTHTTRKLYDEWPVYVGNNARDIVTGINLVIANNKSIRIRMLKLHERISKLHQKQFTLLQNSLAMNTH